ncbi:hypothetical protein CRP9_gp05 [Roseobacter phage CRP-9]|jgi:hypothetical protein|nr:hypothetical protein CRP9_gp05 [Roseobacter phage CRP-9]
MMNNPINYEVACNMRDNAQERVNYYTGKIDRLIKQHGTGVRPSWVSTDLAIDQQHKHDWEKELNRLEQWVLSFEAQQEALETEEE